MNGFNLNDFSIVMGGLNLDSIPGTGKKFCSSPKHTNDLWGPTQPPIQWVKGFLSLGIKRLGHEAAYSYQH
jgi:hypothetical protein